MKKTSSAPSDIRSGTSRISLAKSTVPTRSGVSGDRSYAQTVASDAAERKKIENRIFGQKLKKRCAQYLAAIVVNMNVLPYGIALAWASTALPLLGSFDTPLSTGPITETDKALLSACLPFMALVATPVFAFLTSRISRKAIGYMVAAFQLASWLTFMVFDLHGLLYVGRLLVGIAAGGACVQVPTYISEIAEDNIRGALGCILVFALNVGILIEFVLAATISYQAQIIIYFFIPVIFVICNIFVPESPYFFLKQNREEEAIKSLRRLRAGRASRDWENMKTAFMAEADELAKSPFKLIMSSRGMKRGLTIAVISCISQQLSGIFGIISYSAQIFTEAESSMAPETSSVIVVLLQVFGTILSLLLVDRIGRRFLLIVSGIGIIISQSIMAIYFALKYSGRDVSDASVIPLVCLSAYMVVFSLGFSPLPFVLITELLPHAVASTAVAISLASLWTAATFVTLAFNPLSLAIGVHSCFIIFTVCTVFATIFIILCLPETKGRSLTEIKINLEQGSWIVLKKREPTPSEAPTSFSVA